MWKVHAYTDTYRWVLDCKSETEIEDKEDVIKPLKRELPKGNPKSEINKRFWYVLSSDYTIDIGVSHTIMFKYFYPPRGVVETIKFTSSRSFRGV